MPSALFSISARNRVRSCAPSAVVPASVFHADARSFRVVIAPSVVESGECLGVFTVPQLSEGAIAKLAHALARDPHFPRQRVQRLRLRSAESEIAAENHRFPGHEARKSARKKGVDSPCIVDRFLSG